MCGNDVQSKTKKARALIAHFRREIEESVAIRRLLLAPKARIVAKKLTNRSARLYDLIGKALLQRQLMLLMRLYDKDGRDRACLMRLFDLLNDREVRDAISGSNEGFKIQAAIELWSNLRDDPRKASLREIRDAVAAHNLLEKRHNLKQVTYDQFWSFSIDTEKLVENLASGSGVMLVRLARISHRG